MAFGNSFQSWHSLLEQIFLNFPHKSVTTVGTCASNIFADNESFPTRQKLLPPDRRTSTKTIDRFAISTRRLSIDQNNQRAMYDWSAIALTCRNEDGLAAAYHQELRSWKKKGVLASTTETIVVEDPGPDLGSGGATLNAILVVSEELSVSKGFSVLAADVIRNARILVLHVGRHYSQEPCGAAAFLNLPSNAGWLSPTTNCRVPSTPLLHTFLNVSRLAEASGRGNGLWVCGADSFLVLDDGDDIDRSDTKFLRDETDPTADILLYTIPVRMEYAVGKHGVYRLDEQNAPREIVYRPSIDQLDSCRFPDSTSGNNDQRVPLVLALAHLKPSVAESLLHLQTPLDRCTYLGVDAGSISLKLSFFFDFLAATFTETSESNFASGLLGSAPYVRTDDASPSTTTLGDQSTTTIVDEQSLTLARQFVWKTLNGFSTRVFPLKHRYYHYFSDDPSDADRFRAEIDTILRRSTDCLGYVIDRDRTDRGEEDGKGDADASQPYEDISAAFSRKRLETFKRNLTVVEEVLKSNRHECLLPVFLNSCIDGFARDLLSKLDQIAIECKSTSITGRTLSCMADVLGFWASGHGGLRSGPAQNAQWTNAMQMLETGQIEDGIRLMAELRSRWSARPDRLIRAARHYEAAAQIFTRRTVMDSVEEFILRPVSNPSRLISMNDRLGHRFEAASRIDWSGGWSDTPPITYENGGAVLNLAITIDGKRPVGAMCRRLRTPEIAIVTSHYGEILERLRLKSLDEIRRYTNPGAPGALVCAAFVCTRVLDPENAEDTRTLAERLSEDWAGGFEITVWSDLPHGSGMGSSSILAGCIVASIWKATTGQMPSLESILNAVLYVEQLLTTGGGWQDQVGGLYPGVKMGRFECDRTWNRGCGRPRLTIEPLPLSQDQESYLNGHLLLVYTGKTRLAKNLLQEVVRSWYSRKSEIVRTVGRLVSNAENALKAFARSDWPSVAECARTYWEQKKLMAGGGSEPERVTRLLSILYERRLIEAGWLAGAGGGGFLYLMTIEADCKSTIEGVIDELGEETSGMSVHTVAIDTDPFHYEEMATVVEGETD